MSGVQFPQPSSAFTRRAEEELRDPRRLLAFRTLREAIADVDFADLSDDMNVYRFLKARDFDAGKAEQMIRNHVSWRKEMNVDDLLTQYRLPEVIARFMPGGFCGVDKEGQPVWYSPSGRIDPDGLLRCMSKEEMLRVRIYYCELFQRDVLPRVRRETGLPVYTCTFVIDLEHFSRQHLQSADMQTQSEFMRICEQNYPETMGNSYLINTPKIFPVLFKLCKPFMAQETLQKMHVLGKDYQAALQERIDPSQIPVVYGGTMRAPDDRCSDLICWGGTVPQSMYKRLVNPELLDLTSVKRRSKFCKEVTVQNANSFVEWEFSTIEGDLGFSLVHEDGRVLVQQGKVNCGTCPSGGATRCHAPGKVVATFSNSSSWTRSKKLNYYVRVVDRPSLPIVDPICRFVGVDASQEEDEKFQHDLEEVIKMAEEEEEEA